MLSFPKCHHAWVVYTGIVLGLWNSWGSQIHWFRQCVLALPQNICHLLRKDSDRFPEPLQPLVWSRHSKDTVVFVNLFYAQCSRWKCHCLFYVVDASRCICIIYIRICECKLFSIRICEYLYNHFCIRICECNVVFWDVVWNVLHIFNISVD